MFDEVPRKKPYWRDPQGERQIRDYEHMLAALNHVLTRAPEWTDTHEGMGVVGVPLNALFDYAMGTPSGHAAFLDPEVNKMIKKVLNAWGEYLKTPESAHVLDKHALGWFGEAALRDLVEVGNAPLGTSFTFEELYECDPTAKHYGFNSWDDFFTRKIRDKARPVASPNNDSVIVNACESKPYNVAHNIKLRDCFYAKGHPYSALDMLGHDERARHFAGGTVYQAFLCALSYHRWHSPVSGTIVRRFVVEGTYFSKPLSNDAAQQPTWHTDTQCLEHSQGYLSAMATRAVVFIEADNPDIGLVAFVGIGIVEVSTCHVTVAEGQWVNKGDELGMFHFGGSSYCVVFGKHVKLHDFPPVDRQQNVPVRGKLAVVTH
ncbi:hypothetical protein CDD81_5654 [Ophiocordyceps australis]|uniref:L-tryptophan decarboxylase PsiD-like domain-containing protein n=1 Tax=Ophiocordyceps australis TaxID=1399860 RepID=A0A2C5XDE7_9HYPO|nr:hypothetical protein CDD81_5654 [Ophiocordyceps australis]